jgi:MFS family permease
MADDPSSDDVAGYGAGQAPAFAWSGVSDKRSYYRLFLGYFSALLATGVSTVVLAMLAFDIAGEDSGAVIGTALSLKMLAYIIAAPVVTAMIGHMPRKAVLIGLDVIRAASLGLLALVTEVWQIYALVFAFSLASATFSFVYLATIPLLLGSEEDYTRSLARSRIAAELEGPLSPLMAAGLLLLLTPKLAVVVTALVFILSAVLVKAADIPATPAPARADIYTRLRRGPRLFVAVPAFRALIALDVAVGLASAMVKVNTVVLVQGAFLHLDRDATALAFGAFGIGSVVAALLLPPLHSRVRDRTIMLAGVAMLVAFLFLGVLQSTLPGLLALWFGLGAGVTIALTPATYLIRRLGRPADLQVLMAAQMSIANASQLVAFALAGWLGAELGMAPTFAILGALTAAAALAFVRLWPASYAPEP